MALDPLIVNNIITGAAAWGAAFIVALWLSLIIWTYRDIRSRARDPLLRILAAILVALLFIPGIAVYLVLRPPRTLEDEYQHTLEEEALLQSIEEIPICPGCGRHIETEWMVCPNCHTRLKKPCHNCHQLMELAWNLCPYCGTPAPGMRKENQTMDDVILQAQPADEDTPDSELEFIDEPLDESGEIEQDRLNKYGAP